MKNIDYKKLNQYLNDLAKFFHYENPILAENYEYFAVFGYDFYDFISNFNLEMHNIKEELDGIQILDISRKMIDIIHKDYGTKFAELIDNGVFNYKYVDDEGYNVMYKPFISSYCGQNQNKKYIQMNNGFNHETITSIVHEFMHYTNIFGKNEFAIDQLTEFISIYFEMYTMILLCCSGYQKNKFQYEARLLDMMEKGKKLYKLCTCINIFEKLGDFNENTYDEACKYFNMLNITKEEFYDECYSFLNNVEKKEKYFKYVDENGTTYEMQRMNYLFESFNQIYKYFICTAFSFYALKYSSKDNILKINELLSKNNSYSILKLLEIGNVDISEIKMDDKFICALTDYLNFFEIKMKEDEKTKVVKLW